MKVCVKCKIEKSFTDFRDNRNKCKVCTNLESKEWREKNKHSTEYKKKKKESDKKYREKNLEKIRKQSKEYYEKNKEYLNEQMRQHYEKNKEKYSEWTKLWRKNNSKRYEDIKENYKGRQKELRKIRYEKNKAEENLTSKKYYELNKETQHYRKTKQDYKRERKKKDNLFNLRIKIAGRIYVAFKSKKYSKNTITEKIIGCSWKKVKLHIENQFTENMNWDNYGYWQVDHIIPLASAINEEEMIKLSHYRNLQPLSKEENLKKKDKYNPEDKKKFLEWYEKNVI